MSRKKKKYDLFDETMKVGTVSAGSMFAVGMPGLIGSRLPGTCNVSRGISKTSSSLSVLPTIQSTSSVFSGLGMLEDVAKKSKKKW